MIQTFDTYQEKTNATVEYPKENAKEYLLTGLISEVGELFGKVAKDLRGDKIKGFNELIRGELGDICWFIAQGALIYSFKYSKAMGINDIEAFERRVIKVDRNTIKRYYSALATLSSEFYMAEVTNAINATFVQRVIYQMTTVLAVIAKFYDTSLKELMNENIKKLSSRKRRGKIKGSGDKR